MSEKETTRVFENVRKHAATNLPRAMQQTTNLHLDEHLYAAKEFIGPEFQKITADRSSILVFADDDPMANFSHACRYLLYDAKTGEFYREMAAKFPPFSATRPSTLKAFHEPVKFADSAHFAVKPVFRGPIIVPDGERFAVLFSGMSNRRHLNDMEFLFRTLVDTYGFKQENIFSLSFNGKLETQEGKQSLYPDGTPYRINIKHEGSRSALEGVFDQLKGRLKSRDELLIHTNNHGGWDNTPGSAYLCTYPAWTPYYCTDFAAKLGTLPKFNNLIAMMEQCHAGGFNLPVLAHSTAAATSIASAAIESKSSYVTADGQWDPFARDWIAAQAGHGPFGNALAFNPDFDRDRRIEAEEAFGYADVVRDSRDTPNFNEKSEAGGDITLSQKYRIFWWYPVLVEALRPHYLKLPLEEYQALVRKMQPELQKLATTLERKSEPLKKEAATEVTAMVTSIFGKAEKTPAAA
jgi:hypothetical protein